MRIAVPSLVVVLALGLAAAPGRELTPYLVKNLETQPIPASSSPHDFRSFGRLGLFTASDGEAEALFWRSDGTDAGTFPLVPDCPQCRVQQDFFVVDPSGPFSFFHVAALVGVELVEELWVTRGRPANTVRLAQFRGGGPRGIARWIPEQGRLYFTANDFAHGTELWTSDGTPAGTFLVADLNPGSDSAAPSPLVVFQGQLYFGATSAHGGGLWKTDGTARGTVEVKRTGRPTALMVVGGKLLFLAFAPNGAFDLWTSDGTSRGTVSVTEVVARGKPFSVDDWNVAGGRLFFVLGDGKGQSLWGSDGTRQNTRRLAGFPPPQALSSTFLWALGNQVLFAADDGVHGRELWASDGTPAGTRLVLDGCPGKCWGGAFPLAELGGRLFFAMNDGVHGEELWATNGTRKGTGLVRDLCPGSCSSYPFSSPFSPLVLGNGFFFSATDAQGAPELWHTDGTTAGTVRLASFPDSSLWRDGFEGATTGTQLLFEGEDPQHGRELWRSDGTAAGTRRVKDLAPADLGFAPISSLTAAGDRLYFLLDESVWRSDGTDAGTVRVKDLGPQSSPSLVAAAGTRLFFLASSDGNDRALWASDGTEATTVRLTSSAVHFGSETAVLGSTLLFTGDDAVHGFSLWKSDGTPEGTGPVAPLAGDVTHFTVFNHRLFFFLEGGDGNEQLWSTDGSVGGTAHVADLHSRFNDENPPLLTAFAGRLYFFASDDPFSFFAQRLWSTDGTEAGTRRVITFGLGDTDSLEPLGLSVAGGRLFVSIYRSSPEMWVSDGTEAGSERISAAGFGVGDPFGQRTPVDFNGRLIFVGLGSDPSGPQVLWASDGTAAGTAPLLDRDGQPIRDPLSLRLFAGRLLFAASGPGGVLLWQSDGTSAGTQPVLTLGGEAQGFGEDLTVAGERIYFKAYQSATGTELWALRPD